MKKILQAVIFIVFLVLFSGLATAETPVVNTNVTDGDAPLCVQFSFSMSAQNITSYQWWFGDGTISYDRSPMHTFTNPGMYSVKLEVQRLSPEGKKVIETTTYTAYIKVGEGYAGDVLTRDELYAFANKSKEEWKTMKWVESSVSPSSGLNVATTTVSTSLKATALTATKSVVETATTEATEEVTAEPTQSAEPTSTYDAQSEIEALKKQNEDLQKQIDEQGNILDQISEWFSKLTGGSE